MSGLNIDALQSKVCQMQKHSEQEGESFSTLAAILGRKEECLTVMRPFSISQ
jgi:hypothetical protein